LNLASETIALAVNLLDRYMALASYNVQDVKKIAVTTLVLASKMHGRSLNAKQLVAPGAITFSAEDVMKLEIVICKALKWEMTPVSPYEIMKHLMLFSAADGITFKNLVLHAQLFLDYTLCDYKMLHFSQAALAMSAMLQAHKAAKHCPQQWLEAVKEEMGLSPLENEEVHACIWAMDDRYEGSGLGIPPRPLATTTVVSPPSQVSHKCVAEFNTQTLPQPPQDAQKKRKRPIVVAAPAVLQTQAVSPQDVQEKRKRPNGFPAAVGGGGQRIAGQRIARQRIAGQRIATGGTAFQMNTWQYVYVRDVFRSIAPAAEDGLSQPGLGPALKRPRARVLSMEAGMESKLPVIVRERKRLVEPKSTEVKKVVQVTAEVEKVVGVTAEIKKVVEVTAEKAVEHITWMDADDMPTSTPPVQDSLGAVSSCPC
jgi:hypothetical protein